MTLVKKKKKSLSYIIIHGQYKHVNLQKNILKYLQLPLTSCNQNI
jgi:hypothetical protein